MNRLIHLQAREQLSHTDIFKESGSYAVTYHLDEHASLDYRLQVDPTFNGSIDLEFHAHGPHAYIQVRGLYILGWDQKVTITTKQMHNAPHTRTDVLIKGIIAGNAQSVYKGTIYVHPHANSAYAAQYNKNILISPTARAQSIPSLEVLHNNVRCMHGSAVGQLSDEQLYYVQSRGLTRREATTMLLAAFCSDVITDDQELTSRITHLIGGANEISTC